MKYVFLSVFIILEIATSICVDGQNLKSPSDFLGYPLGTKFTYHHKVIDYFDYVESQSDRVLLYQYGQTYERRELKVAYISSPENLNNIEEIKINNIRRTGMLKGQANDSDIAIIWLSYNVHGNEANSTETSMKVLYELASGKNSKYNDWLENLVIVLDPCLNPDGRERYTNWYNQVTNLSPNSNVNVREHHENWAHGRSNHYLFDLNRDWAWQTQIESEQRLKLYNEWMPQVHVDFHEQYFNSQYYFAPAAQPMHNLITDWQKEFQEIVGKNNGKYFDEKGWLYFTHELFDLLYPGYGDTYPTFNGAIGMTYEMPGHSTAGLSVITKKGDTLTLRDRIDMHFTSSMATLEASHQHRQALIIEFAKYFISKSDGYYVLKSTRPDRIELLIDLLDKNKIIYKAASSSGLVKAHSYEKDKSVKIELNANDLIIPQNQPKSTLVEVLFERKTSLSDTLTYDITAWSLPFVYGLDAYLVQDPISLTDYIHKDYFVKKSPQKPYAYLLNWSSIKDAEFLSAILNKGIKANFSTKNFSYDGMNFCAGTLVITRADNEKSNASYEDTLLKIANTLNRNLVPVFSGSSTTSSIDLGSPKINFLKKPKISMICGDSVSTRNFGELWYFFEQDINFPIDIIRESTMSNVDLGEYDVLLLAAGTYPNYQSEEGFKKIDQWVKDGGSLILFGSAIKGFVGEEKFGLEKNKDDEEEAEVDEKPVLYPFEDSERENLKKHIQGGIIKMEIDNSHPLAFGYDQYYYTLKTNANSYKFLQEGWNVGYISGENQVVAGFIGSESKEKLNKNLVFGVEQRGKGKVIYFVDNPVFRAFWQNGKLFLANAVFFNN